MIVLALIMALCLGLVAGFLLRPMLAPRLQQLLPFLPGVSAALTDAVPPMRVRMEAAIAEIERQIAQGIDRDRNATRLQILREVMDGD